MRIAQTALDRVVQPLALLTVLPVARRRVDLPAAGHELFPAVGLLIGAILVALDQVTGLVLPTAANSALVIAGLVVLSGALHLDGLADAVDGLAGGRDRAQRLAIMRDPRSGVFGFTAVALVLLLKWAALIPMEGWLRSGSLLLVPSLARWSVLPAMTLFPAARAGMGSRVQSRARWSQVGAASLVAVALAVGIFWPAGVALLALALVAALAAAGYASRQLGGLTGDVFGSIVEVNETLLLLVVATSVSHPWLT